MRSPGAGRHTTTTSSRAALEGRATMGAGWTVPSYLLTGAGFFGWLGWVVDRWLDTSYVVAVGVLVGMALSIYIIWIRYVVPAAGGSDASPPGRRPVSRPGGDQPEEAM